MKIHAYCSCLALFLFSFQTFASDKIVEGWHQNFNSTKKIKASFSVPVAFLASEPNCKKMEEAIYEWVDGAKYPLKPDAVFEVSFIYKEDTILMRSLATEFTTLKLSTAIFFRVLIDGPVNLYSYTDEILTNSTTGGIRTTQSVDYVKYVLQRDGEGLARPRSGHYVSDLCDYFSDCPQLVHEIKSGFISDIELIVQKYNHKCGEKRKPAEPKNDRLRSVPANLERQSSDSDGF